MPNRQEWDAQNNIVPVDKNGRGELLRHGLKVAARTGLTRRAIQKGATLAESRLPRQLSRALMFTQVGLITRWLMLVEWGALALTAFFGAGSLWLVFNRHDSFLAAFGLIVAGLCFLVWKLVQRGRRFAERQVMRGFGIFQQLVTRGEVPAEAWPQWFRQWRSRQPRSRN